jgi:hypothetical protein
MSVWIAGSRALLGGVPFMNDAGWQVSRSAQQKEIG